MLKPSPSRRATRRVVAVLRIFGAIDMAAFAAVVMPTAWMAWVHQLAGLGELPDVAITGYLTRSASALYALHGAMLVFMSFDVERYWHLVRFLALVAILHGGVMFSIDAAVGMPLWWTVVEGPTFALTGIVLLAAQGRASGAARTEAERERPRAG